MSLSVFLKEYFTPLLAMALGLFSFRYFNFFWRTLFFQLVIYLITLKIVYYITPEVQNTNNHWFYNGYIFIETAFLCIAPFMYFKSKGARLGICALFLLYLMVFFTQLSVDGFGSFANFGFACAGFIVTIIYGAVLYNEFRTNANWLRSAVIWASLGLLFFYTCNVPYFSLFNYLNAHYPKESRFLFNFITDVLANVRYFLLAVSFWLLSQRSHHKQLKFHEQ